ncbi:MAG: DNA-binding protein [Candidatus Methanomethylophilaceae archaeon]
MDENELDAIRQRKMMDLQRQGQQNAAAEERAKQMEAQKQAILRQILTPEARDRLGTVRIAYPDMAEMVESQLIQIAQSGRLNGPIDDNMLRDILRQVTPKRREISIERR